MIYLVLTGASEPDLSKKMRKYEGKMHFKEYPV